MRLAAPPVGSPGNDSDFYFVPVDDPAIAVSRIIELAKNRIPKRFGLDPVRDIQVLCPMNRGGVGARSLNIELPAALNPAGDRKVERFGWTFAAGDKVMQVENDYDKEVYNGDIGSIGDIDPDAGELAVTFDSRSFTYRIGELDMLVPAYAATIHKSQGSGISRRDHPGTHSALRHAAAQSSLYRRPLMIKGFGAADCRLRHLVAYGHNQCGSAVLVHAAEPAGVRRRLA
jgi:hypothetical protein